MLKFKKEKIKTLDPNLLLMKQRGLWVVIFKSPLQLGRNQMHAILDGFQRLRTYDTIEQAMQDLIQHLGFPISKLLSLGVHFVNMYSMAPTPQELRRLYGSQHVTIFIEWVKTRALHGAFPNIGIDSLVNMSINNGASTGVDIT